jgi:hypothetical protein
VGSGVVAIGGDGALRAEILIDGTSRGFAPRLLDLPVGSHAGVLVLANGRRVTRALHVLATHTAAQPLRWLVP